MTLTIYWNSEFPQTSRCVFHSVRWKWLVPCGSTKSDYWHYYKCIIEQQYLCRWNVHRITNMALTCAHFYEFLNNNTIYCIPWPRMYGFFFNFNKIKVSDYHINIFNYIELSKAECNRTIFSIDSIHGILSLIDK